MPLFNNVLAGAAGQSGGDAGYKIERSLRFNSGDQSSLERQISNTTTFSFSFWYKHVKLTRSDILVTDSSYGFFFYQHTDGSFRVNNNNANLFTSNGLYRDPSAWYHCLLTNDGYTLKLYVNGVLDKAQTVGTLLNAGGIYIGRDRASANSYGDFYMADAHFIDGLALAPTDFGEFSAATGVWNPIEFAGTTQIELPATVTPTLSNGAIIVKGVGGNQASGTITSGGGNLNFFASGNGINWTHVGSGTSHTYGGGDWLAAGGAGTSPRTFTTSGAGFQFAAWNTNTNFDQGGGTTTDVTGLTFSDPPTSAFGAGGFHLDFADASNLGNDAAGSNNFTATNLTGTVPSIASPNLPGWGNPDSYWNLSNQVNSNYLTATYSGSGTYKGVTSNILASNTTYHFFLEQYAGSNDSYSGWFFVDASSAPSNTVPDELGGDTLGQRVGETHAGHHGSYATANGGTNGQDKIDLTSIRANTSAGAATFSEWVINTSVNKVWVRAVGASGWIGGGNPATTSSTPSFNLSSATNKRFGYMGWGSGTYAKFLSAIGSASDIDSLFDSPTNYDDGTNIGGNYCTWNPLDKNSSIILSNGNLEVSETSGSQMGVRATQWVESGAWYWEVELKTSASTVHNGGQISIGVANENQPLDGQGGAGAPVGSVVMWPPGTVYQNGSTIGTNNAYNQPGTVVGVALDMDNKTLAWYINGTLQSVSASGLESRLTPFVHFYAPDNDVTLVTNFGQRPFKYTNAGTDRPAATFLALCTQNFVSPLIADPSEHFAVKLYSGSGATTRIGGPVYSASADSGVTNAGYMFNGDSNNGGYYNGTGTNKVLTTSPFTINTQLRVYNNFRSDGTYAICLNDSCVNVPGSGTSSANFRWSTVDLSSFSLPLNVTKLGYSLSQNSGNTIKLIEVDGTVLIDGVSTPTKFKPDLAWLKSRATNRYHFWHDSVRGSTKALYSNVADVEYDYGSSGVTAFHNDGLTVNGAYAANYTNEAYVAWLWNGGDLATTSSSSYDQSKVWSSFWSATNNGIEAANPATKSFDGVLTGLGMRLNASSSCTWAPTGGYSYSGDFLIYACKDNSYTGTSWTVVHAGGTTDITSSVAAGTTMTELNLTNLGVQSPITSISFTSNNNGNPRIAGMKANGKILIDPGVIPAGSLNSTVYNTSQNWSVSGSNMQNNWSDSFDGGMDDFAIPNTGYSSSMTFSSAISYQTLELVVSRDLYGPDLLVNGNSLNVPKTDTNQTNGRYKKERYYFTNGTLTSIGHETRNTAGQGGSGFWQIIVDGKILVDTNQASSAPNIPSIPTTCTSNPAAGFAISTYTGNSTDRASIATNLGSTPEMVIVKARDKSDDWRVYHVGAGNPYYLRLQLTSNKSGTNNWREMSLNYFALDADSAVNSSSYDYVAYTFSTVPGYSRVGSYEANSSSDGRFVPLDFRPRFIMVKNIDDTQHSSAYNWTIVDTARYPYNKANDLNALYANSTTNEDTYSYGGASTGLNIDVLANGFKLRSASAEINNGNTYIYYAVAEAPFAYGRAR